MSKCTTKIIFILIDGLNAQSVCHMGYMAAHARNGSAHGTMFCVMPPISRPIYATIFTGHSPLETKITHNMHWQLPTEIFEKNFFKAMHKAGFTCAAAAHYWMRELFFAETYNPDIHRMATREPTAIHHGIYYMDDAYPDSHVLQDAHSLHMHYAPDFLLVHTMGVDHAGHMFGGDSVAYRQAVRNIDTLLAYYVPKWLAAGYGIVITSDHGMHADGAHNDTDALVCNVPYWLLNIPQFSQGIIAEQEQWYTYLCELYAL